MFYFYVVWVNISPINNIQTEVFKTDDKRRKTLEKKKKKRLEKKKRKRKEKKRRD